MGARAMERAEPVESEALGHVRVVFSIFDKTPFTDIRAVYKTCQAMADKYLASTLGYLKKESPAAVLHAVEWGAARLRSMYRAACKAEMPAWALQCIKGVENTWVKAARLLREMIRPLVEVPGRPVFAAELSL